MNDLRKLTRIMLAGLAIHILVSGCLGVFLLLPYLVFADSSVSPLVVVQPVFLIGYAAILMYILFFRPGWCIERIIGGGEPSRTDVSWLPVAFRLVSVFSGILYMYWVIPTIFSSLQGYLIARQDVLHEGLSTLSPDRVLGWLILLALGVYLLCGAPHFVRWQVKKTLEQSAQPPRVREEGGESTA